LGIGCDLDEWGLKERNAALGITETPVDPESLKDNPLSVRTDQDAFDDGDGGYGAYSDEEEEEEEDEDEDDGPLGWPFEDPLIRSPRERRQRRRGGADAHLPPERDDPFDDGYYSPQGYFMGQDPRKLVIGHREFRAITMDSIRDVFARLDHAPPRGTADADFDPEDYVVRKSTDRRTGETTKVYHWDDLATPMSVREFEGTPIEDRPTYVSIVYGEAAAVTERIERALEEAFAWNVSNYKMVCPLPEIEEDRRNSMFYEAVADQGRLFKYPGDIIAASSRSVADKWKDSQMMGSLEYAADQMRANPSALVIDGYSFDGASGKFELKKKVANSNAVLRKVRDRKRGALPLGEEWETRVAADQAEEGAEQDWLAAGQGWTDPDPEDDYGKLPVDEDSIDASALYNGIGTPPAKIVPLDIILAASKSAAAAAAAGVAPAAALSTRFGNFGSSANPKGKSGAAPARSEPPYSRKPNAPFFSRLGGVDKRKSAAPKKKKKTFSKGKRKSLGASRKLFSLPPDLSSMDSDGSRFAP
jgi:hypothetical protein